MVISKIHVSYFLLFFVFLAMVLVSPLLPGDIEIFFVNVTFSCFLLASIATVSPKKSFFYFVLLSGIFAATLNTISLVHTSYFLKMASGIASLIFIGTVTAILFQNIYQFKSAETDLVFGSICVYVLLGVLWAIVYFIVSLNMDMPFKGLDQVKASEEHHPFDLQPFLYFSFVTQTTLGYGDVTPSEPLTLSMAIVQAIMGQFYIAIVVASLVGILIKQKMRRIKEKH